MKKAISSLNSFNKVQVRDPRKTMGGVAEPSTERVCTYYEDTKPIPLPGIPANAPDEQVKTYKDDKLVSTIVQCCF